MPPFSDRQRLALAALGMAEQNLGIAAIGAALRLRMPGLTDADVQQAINDANVLQSAAVGASLAAPTDTVADVVGRPDQTAPFVVEALVTVTRPGQDPEYRTLRYDDVHGDTSVDELMNRIQDTVDDWDEQYEADGRQSSFSLRYIM